ncbi:MAG TPA: NAD(P)H-dependent oxidoreductase [Steroidobacteraceae bacterium]|jgi:FMN-dependent NADH-azoreductase
MKLLQIDSSILGDNSASRALTRAIVGRLRKDRPDAEVTHVDLAAEELPHFSGRSLAQQNAEETARNVRALEEFKAADVIVVGAPMYNFGIPSQLKAWIDRVVVAGQTFRYTAAGPEGLAGGKRVIVAVSRGGVYGANGAADFVVPYLKQIFGFVGIKDLTFVRAEGLALSADHRQAAMNSALAVIEETLPKAA